MIGQLGNVNARLALTWATLLLGPVLAFSLGFGDLATVSHRPFPVDIDPIREVARDLHVGHVVTPLFMALASLLASADVLLERYAGWYRDELNSVLKDIGDEVKHGASIEAATHKAVSYRTTPPAWVFQEALRLSEQAPFDQALRHVSCASGQPAAREVGALVASAVGAGGDFGPALRWLAGHLQKMRLAEKEFEGVLSSPVGLLRFVALLAAPTMYGMLTRQLAIYYGNAPTMPFAAVGFFYAGVFGMSLLDGLIYGRWDRVLPKLPLFLGTCRLSLGV